METKIDKRMLILDAEYIIKSLLEYIDSIPDEIADEFPAMPGIDRDYIDEVLYKMNKKDIWEEKVY